GIRDFHVTGVQTCALPISRRARAPGARRWPQGRRRRHRRRAAARRAGVQLGERRAGGAPQAGRGRTAARQPLRAIRRDVRAAARRCLACRADARAVLRALSGGDGVKPQKPQKLKYVDKTHAYYLDGKRAKSVTTVAKVPEDGYALELWGKRMVAIGMASAPHLVEAAAAHFDDRDKLNEIVEEAETLARTHHAATRGTAMHRVTERADRGEAMLLTDLLAATVDAWRAALDVAGYEVLPEFIERAVGYREQRKVGRA